ncbi:ras-like GTP-binding protein RhoL [Euwallacea fornicatus]|uniref:ras-like GTP-binding protein RhoL n=1 Tax=Euwallacea fornicatus TaxID=995702 RepID=UPI00338FABC1
MTMTKLNNIKITAVGDGVVGKTCLLTTYVTGNFPEEYVPTVFEHYGQNLKVDGTDYDITLWDTAGQEDYERLRPLSYPNTNCFLACFCVDKNIASYDNISLKWIPEIRHFCPHIPVVLVATKTDLRNDPTIRCYSPEDGKRLKKKVKAQCYRECSAKYNTGLSEVIEDAVRVATNSKVKHTKPSTCAIL